MSQNQVTNKESIINLIELYLSKWKLVLVCMLIAIAIAFIKIRYSTFMYQANATIKLKEDENSRSLSEISALQSGGLGGSTLPSVIDEIEVIKSRSIITQVVKDLNLNTTFYLTGKVKKEEIYLNPPVNIDFFMSDSIVENINKSLYIKIISAQKYEFSNVNTNDLFEFNDGETKTYNFGEKVKSSIGEFVITPNIGAYGSSPGSFIEIKLRPVHSVVEAYLLQIKINTTEKSNVIKLSIDQAIKEKARLILNKVIEKYNEDVIKDKEKIVQVTSDFITNRLNVVSNELEQVDFTAQNLQQDNRLTALGSQSNIFLESEREIGSRINQTSNQLQMAEFMSEEIKNSGSDFLPADIGITDNNVAQITNKYNELVARRNQVLKNSSDKNPTVVNLNNQIDALKGNLNQSIENIISTNQITLNNLNRENSRIRGQIYTAPTKERQFRDIKRQQDIKESLYLYLLQKREETAITLGMSSANAKVIDLAYTNDDPIAPKKSTIYLASLILGLLIPVSLIYVKDILDNKVHTKEDVQRLIKAPFIGDIPKGEGKLKVVKKVDYSPKAEAFRIIRTNIDFMLQRNDNPCKVIFVTSTTAQEGKSHTTTNLASSFSYSEKKVLLIETDIRVPRVNDYLNITANKGLTDFISDKSLSIKDVTVNVPDNPFLNVIPSGTIPPNPAELLMSDRVKFLFDNVKKDYDYIVVDTAAVGLVTDTLLISDHADIFIYVVSANNIDKRQLHIAQTVYEEKRLPNMVTLLNGSVKKKGYGYGYGNNPNRKKKWFEKLFKR
ncbi:polysaccharide biosynthesis tyrosine autokinase [Psychroserpens sp. AS72]|uniref:GumC family protein n=1 Tax=Psychroserpens sp. AS72 TaxID=3135775 RepID=UPI00316E3DA0